MSRPSQPPIEDEFARALLRSAEGDEPSSAAYAKVAAGLGVGVGLAVSASLPAPAVLAAGAAELAGAARWTSSLAARLLGFGISGALLVGAGLFLLPARSGGGSQTPTANARTLPGLATRPMENRAASVPSPTASAPLDASRTQAAARAASRNAAPGADTPLALVPGAAAALAPALPLVPSPVATAARRMARANSARHGAAESSLSEQVQSLDRARVLLASSNPAAALREILHYRSAWPKGVFLTEASVLEIEALAARGEQSLAATRAAAFVAAHPDSPQAERLRSLIPLEQR